MGNRPLRSMDAEDRDFSLAPCDQNCNVCGKVCPTQAVRSVSLDEKTHAKVGTAILRKEMCLVWAQNKLCLICDEICPTMQLSSDRLKDIDVPLSLPPSAMGVDSANRDVL